MRRAYLFSEIGRFGMERTVKMIWLLLNSSVLFFFIGIVDFLYPSNKTVASRKLRYIAVPLVLVYINDPASSKVSQLHNLFLPGSRPGFSRSVHRDLMLLQIFRSIPALLSLGARSSPGSLLVLYCGAHFPRGRARRCCSQR